MAKQTKKTTTGLSRPSFRPNRFRRPDPVRAAARALIILDGQLLAVQMRDQRGTFYVLPGGGQRHGETLVQTVERECREELGAKVEVGELAYVREYIGCNHQFRNEHQHFHQIETVFFTRILNPEEICVGEGCDNKQVGFEWLPIGRLDEFTLLPTLLQERLGPDGWEGGAVYLGDCN